MDNTKVIVRARVEVDDDFEEFAGIPGLTLRSDAVCAHQTPFAEPCELCYSEIQILGDPSDRPYFMSTETVASGRGGVPMAWLDRNDPENPTVIWIPRRLLMRWAKPVDTTIPAGGEIPDETVAYINEGMKASATMKIDEAQDLAYDAMLILNGAPVPAFGTNSNEHHINAQYYLARAVQELMALQNTAKANV